MKKTKLFAFALALTLAAVPQNGCGFQKEGETLELTMDNSWRSEEILKNFRYGIQYNSGKYLYCSDLNQNTRKYRYCRYDLETGESIEFDSEFEQKAERTATERLTSAVYEMPDGNFGIYHRVEQGIGGGNTETHRQLWEIYDPDFNFIETREIPLEFGVFDTDEDTSLNKSWIMDGKGNWIFVRSNWLTGEFWIDSWDSDYAHLGSIDYSLPQKSSHTVPMLFNGADGTVYMAVLCGDIGSYYYKIYHLDAEKRTCEETRITIPPEEGGMASGFIAGTQGYDYYFATYYGLYGVKNNERIKVIDWINSDFMPGEIQHFQPLEDGRFILYAGYAGRTMYLAEPRTQEEIDNTQIISLASVEHSDDLMEAVIDYNREESGYRIIIKDYSEYNTVEDPELGYTTMKQDMLDGKVADIICPDGVNFESLASKGLFADWYDFMDADEAFSRDNYLQNYFETMETDGKLQRLGFSYVIETGTAMTKIAGEEQGLSLGALLDLAKEQKIDVLEYQTALRFADKWMRNLQTGCINRKTAECCFDSPEFVQFLELITTLEADQDAMDRALESGKYTQGHGPHAYRNGGILLNIEPFRQPINLRARRRHTFFDADITLSGYPMVQDEGNGGIFHPVFTICINAQSSEHEAIWDFMKFFLTEDYQKHLTESMPIHKNALEYKYEEAEGMVTATVGMFPDTSFIGELETWESDILRDYVDGIRTCWYFDAQIHDILMEEVEKLLAGDQTPQECAEMMQSRVSIYLSEQS